MYFILLKEVIFLGHLISGGNVPSDPNKIKCVKEHPKPKKRKQIKTFLGLLNYYRRFVENFAKKAKPLKNLLKKEAQF